LLGPCLFSANLFGPRLLRLLGAHAREIGLRGGLLRLEIGFQLRQPLFLRSEFRRARIQLRLLRLQVLGLFRKPRLLARLACSRLGLLGLPDVSLLRFRLLRQLRLFSLLGLRLFRQLRLIRLQLGLLGRRLSEFRCLLIGLALGGRRPLGEIARLALKLGQLLRERRN